MERLPGFRDFYPDPLPQPDLWSAGARQYVFDRWRLKARRYGFAEYDGPPLEPLELFTAKSGEEIVGQLYSFKDKGGRDVALRPEMTPTLARMFAAHERNYKKPAKWFAIPQLFRYERQQKGRLREHFQFNADILGEGGAAADAEMIALLIDALRSFGLTEDDFVVRLSSRNAWRDFYHQRKGDAAREYEFYQVIDKRGREGPEQTESKLRALGFTMAEVDAFIGAGRPTPDLEEVLNQLAARGLAGYVKVDYQVIRGLAYYTGIVFEAFDRQGELRAIAGGGRYDNLLKLVSGGKVNLPALGFGMGDVVLMELLSARGLLPRFAPSVDLYVMIEEEAMRPASLGLIQTLRSAGFAVEFPLTATKADKSFKRALEMSALVTVKCEGGAGGEIMVKVRNLKTRAETTVSRDGVVDEVRRVRAEGRDACE
jgi:histidyl-tRNA synthetase